MNITSVAGGKPGETIRCFRIDHLGPEIGIPQTLLRRLHIRLTDGNNITLECSSSTELELFGKLLIKHAKKGTKNPVDVDTDPVRAAYMAKAKR